MMKDISGFLVVRTHRTIIGNGVSCTLNPRYRGVALMPTYPSDDPYEQEVLEEYVLGDFRDDDTNLIPSLEKANKLCTWLNEFSKKYLYEVLFCCDASKSYPDFALLNCTMETRGYDIATIRGDYWSIVEDMPPDDWVLKYKSVLNEKGLFSTRKEAKDYLLEYIRRAAPDCEMPFDIVYVASVLS